MTFIDPDGVEIDRALLKTDQSEDHEVETDDPEPSTPKVVA